MCYIAGFIMKTIEKNINSKEFKMLMTYTKGREDHFKYMIPKGNKIDNLLPLGACIHYGRQSVIQKLF